MRSVPSVYTMLLVALLAEGVDRNFMPLSIGAICCVALLAEGVDRNCVPLLHPLSVFGRPPRGGRG